VETQDLDFVVPENGLSTGKRVADSLKGAYYPLDEEREVARVILNLPGRGKLNLDFSVFRGPDLLSDIRGRDFTLNAIAINLRDRDALIDPLGGARDLKDRILRACSDQAFLDDPLRILRGVRLAADLNARIDRVTVRSMKEAVPGLPRVSEERIRDEIFRMLAGKKQSTQIRVMDELGTLRYLFPELVSLKGVKQSPPHRHDVWEHTLHVVRELEQVLNILSADPDPERYASWGYGLMSVQLGRYRDKIDAHMQHVFAQGRKVRELLFLAALYHDAGKPQASTASDNGRIRFFDHENIGSEMIELRSRELRMSNDEIHYLSTVVKNHMRILWLLQTGREISRRAVYRFFRDTDQAGIDVCLLSLADSLATYGPELPPEVWTNQLTITRRLLEAWWEKPEQEVQPPMLVKGGELINELNLSPGPVVGELLEVIKEAQATGQVSNRKQALDLARNWIQSKNNP